MKTILFSDLHIGLNLPTNWYQKTFHQKYLKALLNYIVQEGAHIQDVVILGDWFDYWMYAPTGPIPANLDEIFDANPEVFSASPDGDFITCMDSIQGRFYYINGNHDMTVKAADINRRFRRLSTKGREVICRDNPQENVVYQSGAIYAEHGHRHSLFCRPDYDRNNTYRPLPLGYFLARTWSGRTAACCEDATCLGQRAPVENSLFGADMLCFTEIIKATAKKSVLAKLVLYALVAIIGKTNPEEYHYVLQDGTSINAVEAAKLFPELTIRRDLKGFLVDVNHSLTRAGEKLCKQGSRVVIMGHTHVPEIKLYLFRQNFKLCSGIYVNTGFLSPGLAELEQKKSMFTFAEVELIKEKYIVRLKKVDYPGAGITTVQEISVGAGH